MSIGVFMKYIYLLVLLVGACAQNKVQFAKNKPTIIPEEGIRKGYFYKVEKIFTGRTAGHTGILWAIHDGDKLVDIYFDEQARPTYHTRKYARNFKRLNDYNEAMAEFNEGVGWFNGVRNVELDFLKAGTLNIDIDVVSRASNTPKNAMLPMAKEIHASIEKGVKNDKATRIVQKFDDGIVGDLLVVYNSKNQIIDLSYDELIPEDIKNKKLKKLAGQSKKHSFEYKTAPPARYGFFYTESEMAKMVIEANDLYAARSVFEDKFHDAKILPKYLLLVDQLQKS